MKIDSIHNRLLKWLTVPIVLVITFFSFVIFYLLDQNINQYYDNALVVAKKSIEARLSVKHGILRFNSPYFGLEIQTSSGEGSVFYSIYNGSNKLIAGFENIPKPKKIQTNKNIFYYTTYIGQKIRVHFFQNEMYRNGRKYKYQIIVAETLEDRKHTIKSILVITIGITLLIGLLAIGLSLFAVKKGIEPLVKLKYLIEKRDIHDLTAIKEEVPLELVSFIKSINNLFEKLKKSFSHVEQFNADVSHQLRTPLAELKVLIETDMNINKDDNLKKYIDVIDDMSHITEQLLLCAKTNPDAFDRNWLHPLNLSELCNKYFTLKVPFIYNHGFEFNYDVDDNLWINGGEVILEGMLNNLIGNALKYAFGNISVSLKEENNFIKLCIIDDGRGIPKEHLDKVYDRFFRLDRRQQGSGLGLGIVKQIADLHNALIEIENKEPHGLSVCISFKKISKNS